MNKFVQRHLAKVTIGCVNRNVAIRTHGKLTVKESAAIVGHLLALVFSRGTNEQEQPLSRFAVHLGKDSCKGW